MGGEQNNPKEKNEQEKKYELHREKISTVHKYSKRQPNSISTIEWLSSGVYISIYELQHKVH